MENDDLNLEADALQILRYIGRSDECMTSVTMTLEMLIEHCYDKEGQCLDRYDLERLLDYINYYINE